MLANNVLIRPQGNGRVTISWTSDSPEILSWIFINGVFAVGPFMAETTDRAATLPVPTDKTFVVEVHDFESIEDIPLPVEQKPLVKPQISWNCVETAAAYRIYHTIYETGDGRPEAGVTITSVLAEIPAMYAPHPSSLPSPASRFEIDCPVKFDGRNGRWHSFRVESVDQFGNESENEVTKYFAADLPPVPNLKISRDTETGLLSFRIMFEA